jgi:hypothetical protein
MTLTTFDLSSDLLAHHAVAQALMGGLVALAAGQHTEAGFVSG